MENILIGFTKIDQCNAVKEMMVEFGFFDITLCQSGAEIVRAASHGGGGIVICAYKLGDMIYREVKELLPEEYGMLVLLSTSQAGLIEEDEVFSFVLPVNKTDFNKTVSMILELGRKNQEISFKYNLIRTQKKKKIERSKEEKILIETAKLFLIQKYSMSEEAAHRFIQKSSMDHGVKMSEAAKVILEE